MTILPFDLFDRALLPEPNPRLSEWASENRVLSSTSSSLPGKLDVTVTPYLVGIMDAMSDPDVSSIAVVKGSQIGFTECLVSLMGWVIVHQPSPIFLMFPDVMNARRFSTTRLDPMIANTPAVRERVAVAKAGSGVNTALLKMFDGGVIMLSGPNSPAATRQVPARWIVADDADGFPFANREGDPWGLAMRRGDAYPNRKYIIASTPTLRDSSRVVRAYTASDMRVYECPCPHCGVFQVWTIDQLKWEAGRPATTTRMQCTSCDGFMVEEEHKTRALTDGRWTATQDIEDRSVVGFKASSLLSPLGWKSWASIARDWEDSRDSVELRRTIVNTLLAELWTEALEEAPHWELVYARREPSRGHQVVPRDGLILTAGADVQADRVEVSVYAWAPDAVWLVDHVILLGSIERPEVWQALSAVLEQRFDHEAGHAELRIERLAIDSAYMPTIVQRWARGEDRQRLMLVRGYAGGSKLVGKPMDLEVTSRGGKVRGGLVQWPVNTDQAKSDLYRRLRLPLPTEGQGFAVGYVHLPETATAEFCKQLVSETRTVRHGRLGTARPPIWEPTNYRRNEALDCWTYGYAAAAALGVPRFSARVWAKLADDCGVTLPDDAVERATVPPKPMVRVAFPSPYARQPRPHVATPAAPTAAPAQPSKPLAGTLRPAWSQQRRVKW